MAQQAEVHRAKERIKEAVLKKPNVVGLGTGFKVRGSKRTDELSVVVLVRKKVPLAGLDPRDLVPSMIEGVATDVIQVGNIRAIQLPTNRWRPAPGGVSLGHYKATAGTFGTTVRDRKTGNRLILSNNHVMANNNNASPGDTILQPGAADGGRAEEDTIAHLERFNPLAFSIAPPNCSLAVAITSIANIFARLIGSKHRLYATRTDPKASNLIDAAVARPIENNAVLDEILSIGIVNGTTPATLGMPVRKYGRTTGFTTGEVNVLDVTVNVSYGPGRVARFEDQIVTTPMSQGGDSGSLLVASDALKAVGLLFAGSSQAAIHNPIQIVLDTLEVMF